MTQQELDSLRFGDGVIRTTPSRIPIPLLNHHLWVFEHLAGEDNFYLVLRRIRDTCPHQPIVRGPTKLAFTRNELLRDFDLVKRRPHDHSRM